MHALAAAAACALVAACAALTSVLVPEPYMDEVFHVPQAQRFCAGDWSWDPKITTLPGLYVLPALLARGLASALASNDALAGAAVRALCSTGALRATCALMACALLWALHEAASALHGRANRAAADAARLAWSHPALLFFAVLYYTDVGATLAVVAVLVFAAQRRPLPLGLAATLAVLFRQTNVLWCAFAGWLVLGDRGPSATADPAVRFGAPRAVHEAVRRVVHGAWPLVCVAVAFGAFVVWNGGVAVGDRQAHEAALSLHQLVLCSIFVAASDVLALGALGTMREARGLLAALWGKRGSHVRRRVLRVLVVAAIVAVLVAGGVEAMLRAKPHAYTLADNRHLTFYLWRRVFFRSPAATRLWGAVGGLCAAWLGARLLRSAGAWVTVGAVGATVATLAPVALFEVRYFIVPTLLFRLFAVPRHVDANKGALRWAQVAFVSQLLGTAALVAVLCLHTFPYGSELREVGRFMW